MKAIFVGGPRDRDTIEVEDELQLVIQAVPPIRMSAVPDTSISNDTVTVITYVLRAVNMSRETIRFYCPDNMTDAQVMHRVFGAYAKKKG